MEKTIREIAREIDLRIISDIESVITPKGIKKLKVASLFTDITKIINTESTQTLIIENNVLLGIINKIEIPEGVHTVPNYAFSSKEITELILPSTLKILGTECFSYNKIKKIEFTEGLEEIGDNSFAENQISNDLIIPASVVTLGKGVFKGNNITNVQIPDNFTVLGESLFTRNRITNLIVQSSVIEIENNAFSLNELSSLILPEGLEKIRARAFAINKLTNVIIPSTVTQIDYKSFTDNNITVVDVPIGCAVDPEAFDSGVTINYF